MKAAGRFLISDPDLLSQFVTIVIMRTNVHESKAVMEMFDCLIDWWKVMKENNLTLTETFDIDILLKSFDIIVDIDHHILLGLLFNFLHLYVRTFGAVDKYQLKLVSDRILGSWFYKLFLHWDFKLRCCFHQLIVYHVRLFSIIFSPPNCV
jgi:hypothetical protein